MVFLSSAARRRGSLVAGLLVSPDRPDGAEGIQNYQLDLPLEDPAKMFYNLSIHSISAIWGTARRRTKRVLNAVKQLGATVGVRRSVLVVGLVVTSTVVGVGSVAAECSQSGGDDVHLDVAELSVGEDGNNQVDVSVASDG